MRNCGWALRRAGLPSSAEEGWPRHQKEERAATFDGADGVASRHSYFAQRSIPNLRALSELPSLTAGKKVILANGCFDILHVGHVRYLEGARKLGDALVVALNSDASVKKLKGPDRPILNEQERVALVSALRCVDHVVVFDEPDVTQILQTLRPAVHAKGTDYTEATVPEREQVLAYGGEVRITGDAKDHSTRDVIRKIIETYEK